RTSLQKHFLLIPFPARYFYDQHYARGVHGLQPDSTQIKKIMSLKSKIITKIKEKVKAQGVNLSNVRINAMAEKLDAIVDNEDDIDGEIDKLDQVFSFKELAALDDAKRSADKKAAEEADKKDP